MSCIVSVLDRAERKLEKKFITRHTLRRCPAQINPKVSGFRIRSALAVQLAQLVLGLLQDASLVLVQVLACAVDVERQHGHRGAERR